MLHLYSAGRARPLAARLAEVVSDPLADAFMPEWLAVPSDGMRRWLALELAGRLGTSGPEPRRRGGGQHHPGLSGHSAKLPAGRGPRGRRS